MTEPLAAIKAWLDEDAEGRVMTVVEDPSILDYMRDLVEQYQAVAARIEEAVSILPDPMHPAFPRDKVDAQARAIRLLTLEDPYPASRSADE